MKRPIEFWAIETTGLQASVHRILEVSIERVEGLELAQDWHSPVHPGSAKIDPDVQEIHKRSGLFAAFAKGYIKAPEIAEHASPRVDVVRVVWAWRFAKPFLIGHGAEKWRHVIDGSALVQAVESQAGHGFFPPMRANRKTALMRSVLLPMLEAGVRKWNESRPKITTH